MLCRAAGVAARGRVGGGGARRVRGQRALRLRAAARRARAARPAGAAGAGLAARGTLLLRRCCADDQWNHLPTL